jgi:nitroimidazol reductase NimA-like FMN-containing flavoprotein (pyridoxamine 5'-phosphate oxidase superfamily)
VAVCADNEPYLVNLNHGYDRANPCLYFHCVKEAEDTHYRRLVAHAAARIKDDTLLVLDLSGLTKKYADKMEHPGQVRDGSEKDLGWGY